MTFVSNWKALEGSNPNIEDQQVFLDEFWSFFL